MPKPNGNKDGDKPSTQVYPKPNERNTMEQQWTLDEFASLAGLTEAEKQAIAHQWPLEETRALLPDIGELLDTDLTNFTNTAYGVRNDGFPIIYKGSHTAIYGEPGSGKTMIAKHITAQAIRAGHRVLHIDIDGNFAAVIAQDIHAMQAGRADMIEQFALTQPVNMAELDEVIKMALRNPYDIVIVDSVASLQAYTAADGDNATDYVQRVYMAIIKPLIDVGTTVISIDHTAKSDQAKGAAGTIQKRAKADLALHVVASHESLAKGRNGHVYIYVDKDRYSTVKAASALVNDRELVALFRIPETGLKDSRLEVPVGSVSPDIKPARSTRTSDQILELLKDGQILDFTRIKLELEKSNDATRMALKRLQDTGRIVEVGLFRYQIVMENPSQ